MMRFLPNLTAQNLVEGPNPWDFEPDPSIPDSVRTDKEARTRWIMNPATRHCVYSLVEGLNSSIRVSKGSKSTEGNPARVLHGIVGDYDSPVSLAAVAESVGKAKQCPYTPSWYEQTLSGNARLVWFFAEPVDVPGNEFASEFLHLVGERMRLRHVLAGLDKAYVDPSRYYTNGCVWSEVGGLPLPANLVTGWLVEHALKFNSRKLSPVTMPLDVAARMLAEKYPRFAEWPGEFVEGAQGPSFWVDGSISSKSAVVRPEGIYSFADHATRPFATWADLLGKDAVEKFIAVRMGEAVSDIYYDGGSYWFPNNGVWVQFTKEDISLHLKVQRHLSHKAGSETSTQLERALSHIQLVNRVESAVPLPHYPPGISHVDGSRHLNTANVKLVLPATEPVEWGPSGKIPFISLLLDSIFDPAIPQREAFLAWLSYAYQTAHAAKPEPGQVIFIVGGADIGKTLLSRTIIGGVFGGFVEATHYLMGTEFGGQMFERHIWCVDDGETATTAAGHRRFSEICKKIAANNTFEYHAKYRMPKTVQWAGRCIVTCNDDAVSMRQLPAMDGGSSDKISLFRCVQKLADGFAWPAGSRAGIAATVKAELPYFARWLLDHDPVETGDIRRSVRHGWSAYRHPFVVNSANNSSSTSGFDELLEYWRNDYFLTNAVDIWRGTAAELHRSLNADPLNVPAMRAYTVQNVQHALASIQSRGLLSISYEESEGGKRTYTIPRPGTVPAPPAKVNGVPPRHRAKSSD